MNFRFCAYIDTFGRFIKNQYFWTTVHCPSDYSFLSVSTDQEADVLLNARTFNLKSLYCFINEYSFLLERQPQNAAQLIQ